MLQLLIVFDTNFDGEGWFMNLYIYLHVSVEKYENFKITFKSFGLELGFIPIKIIIPGV